MSEEKIYFKDMIEPNETVQTRRLHDMSKIIGGFFQEQREKDTNEFIMKNLSDQDLMANQDLTMFDCYQDEFWAICEAREIQGKIDFGKVKYMMHHYKFSLRRAIDMLQKHQSIIGVIIHGKN